MITSTSIGSRVANGVIVFVLAITSLLTLAPLVHVLALSFSAGSAGAANLVNFWPVKFTWTSYDQLLQNSGFFRAFGISLERVVLNGVLSFVLSILMAYPLSQPADKFPARKYYVWTIVFTMLFNGGLVPWYMTIAHLGMMNTIWALVLPSAVSVFNVIILMNFFRNLPGELEESAWMDGAGPWYICWRIFVPLSLPALATVTLFQLVTQWNSFFDGYILMNSPANYPLMTYLQQLVDQSQLANLSTLTPQQIAQLTKTSGPTLNAAKFITGMIPVLAVYPFLQRYFITGLVLGSVKE